MLYPKDRFEWERLVRRVKMHPTTKLVALTLASYGNRNGTNAHPGNRLLAADCCIHERSVERHLEWLRDHGLIFRTFRGSAAGRQKLADTYQLVQADNLPDLVEFTPEHPTQVSGDEAGTPDTHVGTSPVDDEGTPDTDDGSSEPEHPTSDEEHPTPMSGTPDIEGRSPDTGVAPPSFTTKLDDQEVHHHAAVSTAAHTHASDDLTDQPANSTDKDQFEIELEALQRLGPDRCAKALDAASADAVGAPWPEVVHIAYSREALAS